MALANFQIIAIHGDKQQQERDWVLNEFKSGKSPVMVATDVASRGIGMMKLRSSTPPHSPFPPSLFFISPFFFVTVTGI